MEAARISAQPYLTRVVSASLEPVFGRWRISGAIYAELGR